MKRSRGTKKKRTKWQQNFGPGNPNQPAGGSRWEEQIQLELDAERRRRYRQLKIALNDSADHVSARAKLGAHRVKNKPARYAGAMHGGGPQQYRTEKGRFTPAHPGYREFGMVEFNPCEKIKERKEVLFAKGVAGKKGSAPGPYKKRSKIKWDC